MGTRFIMGYYMFWTINSAVFSLKNEDIRNVFLIHVVNASKIPFCPSFYYIYSTHGFNVQNLYHDNVMTKSCTYQGVGGTAGQLGGLVLLDWLPWVSVSWRLGCTAWWKHPENSLTCSHAQMLVFGF